MNHITHLIRAGGELLFGVACQVCGYPGYVICPLCEQTSHPEVTCLRQGEYDLWYAAPYGEPWSSLIIAHKDRHAWSLAGYLGALLSACLAACDPDPGTLVVPIPSAPSSLRERGYDHSWQVARRAAAWCDLPAERLLTKSSRAAADQVGLGAHARRQGQWRTMRARHPPVDAQHRDVIVVDDIYTTGASMNEACRALGEAGFRVRALASICYTLPKSRPHGQDHPGAVGVRN